MFQQILAILIILSFLFRLILQKKRNQISRNEFYFWFVFWVCGGVLVLGIKKIDYLVANLGFSSSGINVLFYVAVIILFYFILRLRLRLAKMEQNITEITRALAKK
ncbi:MAG: DUF2304 domain-containing protein [Candidatus Falkowbacteria bacterium]|nr:DUF2304 domain-containing protein [Candidatus Falkowbacteria bacterium]